MPSTVSGLFDAVGLAAAGPVQWGTALPETRPGVYAVALTDDPTSTAGALREPPIDRRTLDHLLAVRPELRMNLARPDADDVMERMGGFWLPDEVVQYIG